MTTKTPRYLFNAPRVHRREGQPDRTDFIRCWKEKREIVVQVWVGKNAPDGEPDGDWGMPGILGPDAAIAQAVLQTKA